MIRIALVLALVLLAPLAKAANAQPMTPTQSPNGLLELIHGDPSGNGLTEYLALLSALQNPWDTPAAQEQMRLALPIIYENSGGGTSAWPQDPATLLARLRSRLDHTEALRIRAEEATEQALRQHKFSKFINSLYAFARAYATKENAELRSGWHMIRSHVIDNNICAQAAGNAEDPVAIAIAQACPKVIDLEQPDDFEQLVTDLKPILDEMNRIVDAQLFEDETLRGLEATEETIGIIEAGAADNSKDFQTALEAKIRRDYSVIRQSAYIAAQSLKRLNVSPENCKLDVDWLEFPMTSECWKDLETHWKQQSTHYDVLLDQLIRHWIGRSVESVLVSQITGCVEPLYTDATRTTETTLEGMAEGQYVCHDHPTIRNVAQYLEIEDVAEWARINYPLDQANNTRLEELLEPLQPLLDWISSRHVIGKTSLGDLLLEFSAVRHEADGITLSWTVQVSQEQSAQANGVLRALPIGLSATLTSSADNINGLLQALSAPWANSTVSTDRDQLRVWLSLVGAPGNLIDLLKQADNDEWSSGNIALWTNAIYLRLPWAISKPSSGMVCNLGWQIDQDLAQTEICLIEAAVTMTKTAIDLQIDQWLKTVDADFSDPIGATFRNHLQQLETAGILWTPEGIEVRLADDPPITAVLATDGTVTLRDANEVLETLARRSVIAGLQSLPYIQFMFTQPDSTDAAEVYWTSHPQGRQLMGTARREGTIWRLQPATASVSLPGMNELRIGNVQIDTANGQLTLAIEKAMLPLNIPIYDFKAVIDKKGRIAVTADPERIASLVYDKLVRLGFNSLDRNAVVVQWQRLADQAAQAFVLDFTGPKTSNEHRIPLDEDFEATIRRVFDQELAATLKNKIARMFTSVVGTTPINAGPLILRQHCTGETIDTCTVSIMNHIDADTCPLLSWEPGTPKACADDKQLDCAKRSLAKISTFAKSVEVENLCFDADSLALRGKAKFAVEQLESEVEAAIEVDLARGAILPDSSLKERINEAVRLGADELLPKVLQADIEAYVERLSAACEKVKQTFASVPGLYVKVQINGKSGCDQSTWGIDNLRRAHELTATFTPETGNLPSFKLEGATFSLGEGLRLQRARLIPEAAIQEWVSSMIPAAFEAGELTIRSQLNNETIVLTTEIPLRLKELGLDTLNVPFEIRVNKDGIHLDQDLEQMAADAYVATINATAPIGIGFQNARFLIESAAVTGPHNLTLKSTMEVKFDEVYKVPGVPINIDLHSGETQLGAFGLGPLCTVIEGKLRQFVQGVNLGSFIQTGKDIHFKGCDGSNLANLAVEIDLEAKVLTASPTKVGVVTMSKKGPAIRFEGGATIPVASTIPLGPVSLIQPQLTVGDKPALTSTVSWPLESKAVAIDAKLRLLKKGGREGLEIGGPIKLVQFIPAGRTDSRFVGETLSSGIDLGGSLRKIVRINGCLYAGKKEDDSCDELGYKMEQLCPGTIKRDSNGAVACGKGHLFQLMHGDYGLEMTDKGRVSASSEVNFILFKVFGQFSTEEQFSHPTLSGEHSVDLGKINISTVEAEVGATGARFSLSVFGQRITLLITNLHRMDGDRIKEMILRLIFPDIDLDKLLEALLSGDITLNPFASFGSGGGEMNADGNDSEGNAGNGKNGNGEDANAAGEESGSPTADTPHQGDEEGTTEGSIPCEGNNKCLGPIACSVKPCDGPKVCTELPCKDDRPVVPKHQWRKIQHDNHRSLGPIKEITEGALEKLEPRSLKQDEQRRKEDPDAAPYKALVQNTPAAGIPILPKVPGSTPITLKVTKVGAEGALLQFENHEWWAPATLPGGQPLLDLSNDSNPLLGIPIIDELSSGLPVLIESGKNVAVAVLHQPISKDSDLPRVLVVDESNEDIDFYPLPLIPEQVKFILPSIIFLADWSMDRFELDEHLLFYAETHRDALFQGVMQFVTQCRDWVRFVSVGPPSPIEPYKYCQIDGAPRLHGETTLAQRMGTGGHLLVRSLSTSSPDQPYKSCFVYLPPSVILDDTTFDYFEQQNWCEPTTIVDISTSDALLISESQENGIHISRALRLPERQEIEIKSAFPVGYKNSPVESNFSDLRTFNSAGRISLYQGGGLWIFLAPGQQMVLYSNSGNACGSRVGYRLLPWKQLLADIDSNTTKLDLQNSIGHCRNNYEACAHEVAQSLVDPSYPSGKLVDLGFQRFPRRWICDAMQAVSP